MKKLTTLLFLVPTLACANPIADNIQIVSLKDMAYPESLKKEMQKFNDMQKQNGFVQTDNEYTRKLLSMRYRNLKFSASTDPSERELKKTAAEVPTTFTYKSVVPNSIAYAGIGIVSNKGFSGIKTFFDGRELGMCTLSAFSRQGVTKPIQLNKDGLRYDVHAKPTRITIEGSHNAGFMYSVRWYDKDFIRDLECANLQYDKSIVNKMITLARKIDGN